MTTTTALLRSFRRSFSALPTRHSRLLPPPICLDLAELREETERILDSKPGTLFTLGLSGGDLRLQSDTAWMLCDPISQQVEYLIKGHSASVDGTIMNRIHGSRGDNPENAMTSMAGLLDRMEEEGTSYMQLREQMFVQTCQEEERKKQQLDAEDGDADSFMEKMNQEIRQQMGLGQDHRNASPDTDDNEQEDDKDNEDDDDDEEISTFNFGGKTLAEFSSPGPTIPMYDTYLDSLAMRPTEKSPDQVLAVFTTLIQRFDLDGGTKSNTNIHTTPTALSFNGVLRACAGTPNTTEEVRDKALTTAFSVYDAFGEYLQPQNAATFAYMIQIVDKFIPPSLTRGNMGLALYKTAREEGVVDDIVVEAMKGLHKVSNGEVHDEWFARHIKGKLAKGPEQMKEPFTVDVIPKEHRKFAKKLRYRLEENIY